MEEGREGVQWGSEGGSWQWEERGWEGEGLRQLEGSKPCAQRWQQQHQGAPAGVWTLDENPLYWEGSSGDGEAAVA